MKYGAFSPTVAHTALLYFALAKWAFAVCILCHFLVRPKKWRKKGAQAFPLGTPKAADGGVAAVGVLYR
jgi:hypothetical protein